MPTGTISEQQLIRRVLKAERKLRVAAVNAIIASRNAPGTLRQLERLITRGQIEDAVQLAARAGAISFANQSAAVYAASGTATAQALSKILDVTIDFDTIHDRAVRQMQQNRLLLVREWTNVQRGSARLVLNQAVAEGLGPREVARRFRDVTGLTAHQEGQVQNYRQLLRAAERGNADALSRSLRDKRFDGTIRRAIKLRQPIPPDKIDRMVARYRQRYVKRRAETIARTEALSSVNAGNHEAFNQALDGGHVQEHELERTWYATPDERTREAHVNASGQTTGLNDPFSVGGEDMMFPGDMNASAENRINCRCSVGTRIRTSARNQ